METKAAADIAAHETDHVSLRDVIMSAPIKGEEDTDLRRRMLAKFDQLVRGEKYAYRGYKKMSRRNHLLVLVIILTAACIPASAIIPIPPFKIGDWAFEPKHITGLAGITLSALLALYQALGLRTREAGFLEMSNRMKAQRDKLALLVRNEQDFRALVEEVNGLRLQWHEVLPPPDVALPK